MAPKALATVGEGDFLRKSPRSQNWKAPLRLHNLTACGFWKNSLALCLNASMIITTNSIMVAASVVK